MLLGLSKVAFIDRCPHVKGGPFEGSTPPPPPTQGHSWRKLAQHAQNTKHLD